MATTKDLKTLVPESGLDLNYEDIAYVIKVLEPKIVSLPRQEGWSTLRVLGKVSKFFIEENQGVRVMDVYRH